MISLLVQKARNEFPEMRILRRASLETILTNKKLCSVCKQAKPINMFSRNKDYGRKPYSSDTSHECKLCAKENRKKLRIKIHPDKMREYKTRDYQKNRERLIQKSKQWRIDNPEKAKSQDLKKKYGITFTDKKEILASQRFCCAACGTRELGSETGDLDHSHKTQKIRAILCHSCNKTLGNSKEDIHRLISLVSYIAKHSEQAAV